MNAPPLSQLCQRSSTSMTNAVFILNSSLKPCVYFFNLSAYLFILYGYPPQIYHSSAKNCLKYTIKTSVAGLKKKSLMTNGSESNLWKNSKGWVQ